MGLLVDGKWHDQWYDTSASNGAFVREDSKFHHQVVPQATEPGEFQAEPDRYHLFVSLACPWAHRTLIFRRLKKLETIIPFSAVKPEMLENGWEFTGGDSTLKALKLDYRYLHQVYTASKPDYTGRVTVPVLWDKKNNVIVNNESSQIIRMFNSSFNEFTDRSYDFYPDDLKEEIDRMNEFVYDAVNNGVYKCGFATTQESYATAYKNLFDALDLLDSRLADRRYLLGSRLTEADWRLFTTLVRFDAVYYSHFKANRKRISDYAHLSHYLKDLYQIPGIAETVMMDQIKRHYYYSHATINPTRIVPLGPDLDFGSPHHRDHLKQEPIV